MLFEVTNTTWENLQIAKHKSVQCPEWMTLICALRFADFSGCVCHLEQHHAQSPFLFPIVFSINLFLFLDVDFSSSDKLIFRDLCSFFLYFADSVGCLLHSSDDHNQNLAFHQKKGQFQRRVYTIFFFFPVLKCDQVTKAHSGKHNHSTHWHRLFWFSLDVLTWDASSSSSRKEVSGDVGKSKQGVWLSWSVSVYQILADVLILIKRRHSTCALCNSLAWSWTANFLGHLMLSQSSPKFVGR